MKTLTLFKSVCWIFLYLEECLHKLYLKHYYTRHGTKGTKKVFIHTFTFTSEIQNDFNTNIKNVNKICWEEAHLFRFSDY